MGETVDPAEDAVRAVDDWIQRMDDRDRAIREAAEKAWAGWVLDAFASTGREPWATGLQLRDLFVAGFLRGHAEGRAKREDEVKRLREAIERHRSDVYQDEREYETSDESLYSALKEITP